MKDRDTETDRPPIERPDPDRVVQGDEAAERKKQRAREDVSEGRGDRVPDEPEGERADRMAERALETRPSTSRSSWELRRHPAIPDSGVPRRRAGNL